MRLVSSIASLAVLAAGLAACAGETAKPTPAPAAPSATAPSAAPAAPAPLAAPAAPAVPAAPVAAHELKKIAPSAGYPLKTCVVSGEDLGAMGDRVAYSYDGTEVQFCCPDCVKEFEANPAPFLAKIAAAK